MALNKAVMMNDGGGGGYGYYSTPATDWSSLIDTSPKVKGGSQSSGAYGNANNTPSFNYDNLPEAEVEVNTTNDTNTGDWFYQGNYDKGSYSSKDDYYSSNAGNYSGKSSGQTEQPLYNYGDYYGTQPLQTEQSYYSPSTPKTTQQQTPNIQKPIITEIEPVAEKTITPQQQNEILINTLLQQSAAETSGNANAQLPNALPLSDMDAIRFGIQQSMNNLNGETAAPTTSTPTNTTDIQGLLDWNWRTGTPVTPNAANMPVQPNLASESVNNLNNPPKLPGAQTIRESQDSTGNLTEKLIDFARNVTSPQTTQTTAASAPAIQDIIATEIPSWQNNLQLPPQILNEGERDVAAARRSADNMAARLTGMGLSPYETSAPASKATPSTPQSTATIAPQQMAQLLNDPLAREFYTAAKRDGETDTNAALFALRQTNYLNENPRYNSIGEAIATNTANAREKYRQAQEKTKGLGTLYGNYLNDPQTSIDNWIERGGLDNAAKFNSSFKNLRVQAENQNRIRNEAVKLAQNDGLDFYNLPMEQQDSYEEKASNSVKLVNETTPEYQQELILNRMNSDKNTIANTQADLNNLIGYSDNETGAQDLGNRNFEPIISRTDYSNLPEAEVEPVTTSLDGLIGWTEKDNSPTKTNMTLTKHGKTSSVNPGITNPDDLIWHGGYNQTPYGTTLDKPLEITGPDGQKITISTVGEQYLKSQISKGNVTYKQIYDQYFNDHAQNLYDRYMASGKYSEAQAREAAITNARSQAFQKIYDLGYRFDLDNPDLYYLTGSDGKSWLNSQFINDFENGINNNYYTNDAAQLDRLLNMSAGHIEGGDDRLFDEIRSELAGNAYANKTKRTNYGTTFNITDQNNANNWKGWSTSLQAAMSGQLTKSQILEIYNSKDSDLIIPEKAKKFFASDPSHALQQIYFNNGKNAGRTEFAEGTLEEYREAIQALIDANPAMKLMVDNGILTIDDIAYNFFKELKATDGDDLEKQYKSYGGGGGGYSRSSGGGGGGGGYGGYGSSGGNSASSKNQDTTRIHNIMKNWTF